MDNFKQYLAHYASLIPSKDWKAQLLIAAEQTQKLLGPLNEDQALFRYQKEKWSIKEVLQHLLDAERIFVYRALRFSRRDSQALAGWDEELYAQNAEANPRPIAELLSEFQSLRDSTYLFFNSLSSESMTRKGEANGHLVSVEELGKLLLGHHLHHQNILQTLYFNQAPWTN